MTETEALKLATHRHYKGGLYRWIADVKDTETGDTRVWYEHIWPHPVGLWDRPAVLFYGTLPDGRRRFEVLAQGPTAASPEAAQAMAAAVEAVRTAGLDLHPEVTRLISACGLVSLHHKLCLDRNIQLEAQAKLMCPECKGAGKVKVRVVDSDRDQGGVETTEYLAWRSCPACNGAGILKGSGIR
jgi:hypothetical protein